MTLSISLNLTMAEFLAHYTSPSKTNLKLVKRDRAFKQCTRPITGPLYKAHYHFFTFMYTTKIESCDAKVYKVAKECIEYCFPDPDDAAECLLNCFEKHIRTIYYPGKRYEKKN